MKKRKTFVSLTITVLTVLLVFLLTLLVPVSSALSGGLSPPVVHIFNAQDLCNLSKNCSFDKWSKGRTVILESDISLNNVDFRPIPIFGGTFDGKGHKITGLSLTVEGSNQGFFRYLQKGAVVKNLTIQGSITPAGDKSNVGGFVGNNGGTVENCKFSGYVKGQDNVGGIAGLNGATGTVTDCFAAGVVYGKGAVGGIAGHNAGTIYRCVSDASVNTTVEEQSLNFMDLSVDDINPFKVFVDAMDIGGIAGINTGLMKNCENCGPVGYPHVGYNVGGVAGRQSGHITACLNRGIVRGRRDVGGIVGQMEPHITVSVDASELTVLRTELGRLQSAIADLLDHVGSSSDAISGDLSRVQTDLDDTKACVESLIDQTEALLNKDIDEINRISQVLVETMGRLEPLIDILADVLEGANQASESLSQSLHHFSKAMGTFPEFGQHFKEITAVMDVCMDVMSHVLAGVEKAASDLFEALQLLYGGQMGEALELLENVREHLQEIQEGMEKVVQLLRSAQKPMMEILELLGVMGAEVGHALEHLGTAIKILGEAMEPVPGLLREISDLVGYLADQPQLDFATTDDKYKDTKEGFYRATDSLSKSVFDLIDGVKRESDVLLADIRKVSDQMFLVVDLVISIADGAGSGEMDLDRIFEDVSRQDVDGKTEGKVSDSKNFGTVDGDINVGGIAGTMAIEPVLDAEEDFSIEDKPLLRIVFRSRAVITECQNSGEVASKKNNAGGIVGNMDLGYVRDCVSSGSVQSAEGHYVGGVAGRAVSAVHSCHAKSALSGGNYVGGIAGYGQEIVDCRSVVRIDGGRACLGAIAGYTEADSVIKNNYFVSEVLAGIDGISYQGRAEPLEYPDFVALDGIPPVFQKFELTFRVDDEIIEAVEFDYGDSVDSGRIPQVPTKPGYYGKWAGLETLNLTSDLRVKAEYFPYETMLESEEKREGPLSVVLVEGQFTDDDRLRLAKLAPGERAWPSNGGSSARGDPTPAGSDDPPAVGDGDSLRAESRADFEKGLLEIWRIAVPDDGCLTRTIRFVPPVKKNGLAIYIFADGGWTETEAKWDGKYMVFQATGNSVIFGLKEVGFLYGIPHVAFPYGLGTAVAVGLIFVVLRRRQGKHKGMEKLPD